MRNLHLDALRGYCLMVMTVDHLRFRGLTQYTHASYGFFDAADGFIFISALVAGGYYSRIMETSGWRASAGRALKRARLIYLTHVLVEAAWVSAFMFAPFFLRILSHRDTSHLHLAFAPILKDSVLIGGYNYDILPFYAVMMLFVPLLARYCSGRGMGWVLGISAGLWLLSQPRTALTTWLEPAHMSSPFCFTAWQFLFVLGFAIGCASHRYGLSDWFGSRSSWFLFFPLAGVFFALRHPVATLPGFGEGVMKYWQDHAWMTAKGTLGPLRMIDFGLFACLLACIAKTFGKRLEAASVHRGLRFLGQHSLQVYAWTIPVERSVRFAAFRWGVLQSRPAHFILAILSVAALFIPARLHAVYRNHKRRTSQQPEGGENAGRGTNVIVKDLAVASVEEGRS